MSALYVVAGLLGLGALVSAFVLAMRGAERTVARALGLPQFRWFDVTPAPAWKVFVVRGVSVLVPYAICAALFWVATAAQGVPETESTVLEVLPDGAAREAGLRDGDEVIAVGDVPVTTWEGMRAQIAKHPQRVELTFERSGQRQTLSVEPRAGLIGVARAPRTREVGLVEAAKVALALPLQVVVSSASALLNRSDTRVAAGPIGIVRATGKASEPGLSSLLHFLGLLGAYLWPFVAGTHAFDVFSGWLFRLTFSGAQQPLPVIQIARLRLALYLSLGCWLALLGAELAAAFAETPQTTTLAVLLTPGVWATWPLLWVSGRSLGKGNWPLGIVLPAVLLPCAAPLMGVVVTHRLGKEERRLRTHTAVST